MNIGSNNTFSNNKFFSVSECVLDEAKVSLSVEFIKNVPMPEEIMVTILMNQHAPHPRSWFISFHNHTAQHQQADDFGRWGAHAEGVICGKIRKDENNSVVF